MHARCVSNWSSVIFQDINASLPLARLSVLQAKSCWFPKICISLIYNPRAENSVPLGGTNCDTWMCGECRSSSTIDVKKAHPFHVYVLHKKIRKCWDVTSTWNLYRRPTRLRPQIMDRWILISGESRWICK